MRTKLLMITLAMLSIFTAQQAIAKSSHENFRQDFGDK